MSSMPKSRPTIHDATLRRALEEAAPTIEAFTETLDRLSADIKNLETYLEQSGVRTAVSLEIGSGQRWVEELSWTKGEPNRWRIVYSFTSASEHDQDVRCPLIEAPIEIRVKARRFLPKLVRDVASAARLGEGDPEPEEDPSNDIPF